MVQIANISGENSTDTQTVGIGNNAVSEDVPDDDDASARQEALDLLEFISSTMEESQPDPTEDDYATLDGSFAELLQKFRESGVDEKDEVWKDIDSLEDCILNAAQNHEYDICLELAKEILGVSGHDEVHET